ncbi:hypothetical protein E6C60_4169 [Paenibacillus algicola]|uniref:Uncharacterized protein n=1 Tax=Paenibacillus algicola TaxID=2565926 RepID=A0A4V1G4J1_9BACL|nr:hypothetical protein [Paenibacillus algicola]QCT04874.1 hypothetical protein E6C60_4169 [Paenibacillus algicola]
MRMLRWLIKISVAAVLISSLTILTTGWIVSTYLQAVLTSFNIELEGQPLGFGGIVSSMFGSGSDKDHQEQGGSGAEAEAPADSVPDAPATDGEPAEPGGGPGADVPAGSGSEAGDHDEAPEGSLPVMGSVEKEPGTLEDQEIVMSPDDLGEKKSSLTPDEKEEIFTLLMTKLPQSEMQRISAAMENGLTASELEEIEKGISAYLSPEEFKRLMDILK